MGLFFQLKKFTYAVISANTALLNVRQMLLVKIMTEQDKNTLSEERVRQKVTKQTTHLIHCGVSEVIFVIVSADCAGFYYLFVLFSQCARF